MAYLCHIGIIVLDPDDNQVAVQKVLFVLVIHLVLQIHHQLWLAQGFLLEVEENDDLF